MSAEDVLERFATRALEDEFRELDGMVWLVFRVRGAYVLAQPAELVACGREVATWWEEEREERVDAIGASEEGGG